MQYQDLDQEELCEHDQLILSLHAKAFGNCDDRPIEERLGQFVGKYDTEAEFAEAHYMEFVSDEVERLIGLGISFDWEATWFRCLKYDYVTTFHDGCEWVFSRQ